MATEGRLVVVGADGSVQSVAALKWAVEYAAAAGAKVRAVMACDYPTAGGPAPLGVAPEAVTDEVRAQMAESLSKVVAEGAAGLDVEEEIAYGHPAQVLIEQSADAGLLVVGSRGHGAFTGMMIGSVSIHCVTHSHCPVVVVRTDA